MMDNKRLNELLNDILLGKFLVNFVPGLILFYAFTIFVRINIGEGLISLVIVTSVAWTLGVLLEMVFFNKLFHRRWNGEIATSIDTLNLLLGKIGISIITACIFYICEKWLMDMYDRTNNNHLEIVTMFKFVFFLLMGTLLYWFYHKQAKKNKHR